MDLNFKFISKEQYNCIENVLVSLMTTWNKEYKLMFAKAWGFTMLPSEVGENDLIGYRIGGGEYKVWECLETYHGVRTTLCDSENYEEQVKLLDKELEEGRPIILQIDGFYTPWKDVYNKYHFIHYCLVVNKNESDCSYGCIDPYENSLINLLPKENIEKGGAKCITVKIPSKFENKIKWEKILSDAANTILMEEQDISGINGIRELAERIERHFDVIKEIEGYEEMIWLAPIIFRISDIGSRRLNFSESLVDLYDRTGIEELLRFAKRVETAGWSWRRVRRTIVTSASDPDYNYTPSIANMIRKVADDEESTARDMIYFIQTMRETQCI